MQSYHCIGNLCVYNKLRANSSKMKDVFVNIQYMDKLYITYNNWSASNQTEWMRYYVSENIYNGGEIKCWVFKKYLFSIGVVRFYKEGCERWEWNQCGPKAWKMDFMLLPMKVCQSWVGMLVQSHVMVLFLLRLHGCTCKCTFDMCDNML